jgi:hypothetical protein
MAPRFTCPENFGHFLGVKTGRLVDFHGYEPCEDVGARDLGVAGVEGDALDQRRPADLGQGTGLGDAVVVNEVVVLLGAEEFSKKLILFLMEFSLEKHGRMAWGGQGLPEVSRRPTMPDLSTPSGWAAGGRLLPRWTWSSHPTPIAYASDPSDQFRYLVTFPTTTSLAKFKASVRVPSFEDPLAALMLSPNASADTWWRVPRSGRP